MKWLDNLIQRAYNRARERDEDLPIEVAPKSRWGRKGQTAISRSGLNGPSVQYNYDDRSVISFKVYSANGGMIVETSRYDEKSDNERIARYVIDESRDFAESLSHIVTMEYMK